MKKIISLVIKMSCLNKGLKDRWRNEINILKNNVYKNHK